MIPLRAVHRALAALLVVLAVAPPAQAAQRAVRDGDRGVSRVIIWDGVTDDFLAGLRQVTPYDLVYRYQLIDGVALAVPEAAVEPVLGYARSRGLRATRDQVVKAMLSQSTQTVHVKASPGSPGAWALGYTGRGVTVGIIDTGIDAAHVGLNDLDDNPSTNDPKVVAFRDWVQAGGNAADPYDDNGHGSHVAGIAAGTGQGSTGDGPRGQAYVGVAYEANLAGFKVLDANGSGRATDIVAAINWVGLNANSVEPPIRVVNMSLGTLISGNNDGLSAQSQAVDAAAARGLIFTISAGNGDTDGASPNLTQGNISSPGDARGAITVCSSNKAVPPTPPRFSDWDSEGPTADGRQKPDVCAPGESVISVDANTSNGYVALSGTSMAAPHVAGIAALLVQAVPHLTPEQVKEVIRETASHASAPDFDSGFGEAQAREAIQLAISRYGRVPAALVARSGGPYFVPQGAPRVLQASASGGKPLYSFAWDLDGDGDYDDATGPRPTVTDTATTGVRTISVRVTDDNGNVATDSTTLEVLPAASVLLDDVEGGPDGWATRSLGSQTAAGWHIQTAHSRSPTHAWYAGNDVSQTYTPNERVRLERTFDLSAGPAGSSGALALRFSFDGTMEPTFDFLWVQARRSPLQDYELLARYDSATFGWRTITLDITRFRGPQTQIAFDFVSDDFNPPEWATATGPFLDDIQILGTPPPPPDTVPPAAVTDLTVVSVGTQSVELRWTAPGDDGTSGTADSYDLRYSTSPIDATNFASAARFSLPAPSPAGTTESATVGGLAQGTTYYFALRASDEAGNTAPISNVVSATTLLDNTPPSKVTGLVATAGDSLVHLSWNPASDDFGIDHYRVYRDGADVLHTASTSADIGGLQNGRTYTFQVSAVDTSGNEGPRSDPVQVTPAEPPAVRGWPQFHGDRARRGASAEGGAVVPPHILQEISAGGSIGSSPLIADLDGDGRLDLVAASDMAPGARRVVVRAWRNTPTGLAPWWTYTVPPNILGLGGEPTSGFATLAVGDLDGNGSLEVAVYSNYLANVPNGPSINDGRMTILRGATGTAYGSVATVIGLAAPPAIGDVNGDGRPEVVFIRQTGGTGDTAGYYLSAVNLVGGVVSQGFDTKVTNSLLTASPALADIRPGRPGLEVVVAEDVTSGRVFLCTPTLSNATCDESLPTAQVRGLAVADLDGDGGLEIVANARQDPSLHVIRTAPTLSRVSRSDGFLWNTPTLGDVDGDGRADIVNVNYSESANDTARQGDVMVRGFVSGAIVDKGTLRRPPPPGSSTQARGGGALADLTADGRPEFVFGSGDSTLVAVRFTASGAPQALWTLPLPANPIAPVAIGDVTGDGNIDLVAGTADGRLVVVGNRFPVLNPVGNRTVPEGSELTITLSATDPDGDPLTFSASNLPPGATFSGRTFRWTPTSTQAGTYPGVRFSVSDGSATASEEITITVTNVPTAPTITSPSPGSLLGTSTVTISGTAEPELTLEVREGSTPLATTTSSATGAWSVVVGFADGTHTITAAATDAAGTTGPPSAAVTFTVDTTAPPPPTISSPSEGAVLSSSVVTLAGSAEAGATVRLEEGGALLATATASGTGAWSVSVTMADGPHTVIATATDAAGNTSAPSAPRSFTVDTSAPAPPVITSPPEGALVASASVHLAGSAEPGAVVRVREGSTVVGTATAGTTGDWAMTATFAEGPHTVTATATDAAGNTSAPSAPRSFTVDLTAPPPPTISSPSEGAVLSSSVVTLAGSAEAGATVRLEEGGALLATATASGTGAWSVSVTMADGPHTVIATATDAAGNTSAPSAPRHFTVDTSAPAPPVITSPPEGALVASRPVAVSGSAEPGTTVTLFEGPTPLGSAPAGSGGGWSIPVSLPDGTHTLTATATDAAGNTSGVSAPRTFTIDTTPPPAPVIEVPAEGAVLASTTVVVSGRAEAGAMLRLREGSTVLATVTADGTGAWSATVVLGEGAHTVVADATDAAGNTGPAASRSFTVDVTPPPAPAITSPSNGAFLGTGAVTLSGTAEPRSTVTVTEGALTVGTATASPSGSWSLAATFPDGEHTVVATATDAAGNVSAPSAPVRFRVASGPPPAPTVAFDDADGVVTQSESAAVTIRGTRATGTALRLTVTDSGSQTRTLTIPAGAEAWVITLDLSPMALGRITASALAIDPLGRESEPATASIRKVPDGGAISPPRVEIRDGDGRLAPASEDLAAVPVVVTNRWSAPLALTLVVSDGNPAHDLTRPLGTLDPDATAVVMVDVRGFDDGVLTATASVDGASPAVVGSDTTILDQTAPTSVFEGSTSVCLAIPVAGFSNCRLAGRSTDTTTGILFVYLTGEGPSGQRFARTARLDRPGELQTTWSLSGSAFASLAPGQWTFRARASDEAGNLEGPGPVLQVLVL